MSSAVSAGLFAAALIELQPDRTNKPRPERRQTPERIVSHIKVISLRSTSNYLRINFPSSPGPTRRIKQMSDPRVVLFSQISDRIAQLLQVFRTFSTGMRRSDPLKRAKRLLLSFRSLKEKELRTTGPDPARQWIMMASFYE